MPTTSSISTRNLTDFSAAHLLRDVQYSTIVQVVKVVIQVVQLVRVVQVVKWWMWDVSVKQHKAFTGAFAYHYRHLEFERCLISPVAPLVWLVWVVQLVKSSGEIAYHYSYLQFGRAVRKGVLSTGTTHSSCSSGEIAYYHSYSSVEL